MVLILYEKVLYVNGQNENYECWQFGDDDWLIAAFPGNEIAAWGLEEFK